MQRNKLTFEFLKIYNKLQGQEILDAVLKWHTAPIIYSSKPSVLINLGNSQTSQLAQLWYQYRKDYLTESFSDLNELSHSNNYNFDNDVYNSLTFTPFMGANGSLHLFCYVTQRIEVICQDEDLRCFLRDIGYSLYQPEYCIARLRKLFFEGCPHEIGVFLGYPLADVKAFIQNKGKNYLINGYWKVYSDVPGAEKLFHSYNQAKIRVLAQWIDM